MFVLSFGTVFAYADDTGPGTTGDTQSAAVNEAEGGSESTDPSGEALEAAEPTTENPDAEKTVPAKKKPAARIIKKGKYYYYKGSNGKIRRKSGFVTADNKLYFVRRGGKIRTASEFKIKKKIYRADKRGVIQTGVYKWKSKYYLSNTKGQWKKKEGFVDWKNRTYYIQKDGTVLTDDGFVVDNVAYCADKKGRVTEIELDGDGSPVIKVAKKQVGIMTGIKYWVWYYKTKFIDTDRTPWCGAFVAWCYYKAGLYDKISIAKKYGPLGYVPTYSSYANKYGKWLRNKKKAKGGDIIIFGWNMHVALIEGVYGDYIVTIEGNAGPTAAWGCGKPGAVIRRVHRYDSAKIKGVIRP